MKIYRATRADEGIGAVTVTEEDGRAYALRARFDLHNHSPSGLEWAYAGSGPAQLALALLADHFRTATATAFPAGIGDDLARAVYQDFKFAVVARLPRAGWTLTTQEIGQALCRLASEDERHFWGRIVGALDATQFVAAVTTEESGADPEPAELQTRAVGIITSAFPVSADYARRQVARYYQHEELPEEAPR